MKKLTELTEWQALSQHKESIAGMRMHDWFKENPERFNTFSICLDGLLFDYSKNRITAETLHLLTNLAVKAGLKEKITALFSGDIVNPSEKNAALHTALRASESTVIQQNGQNIMPSIHATLQKMHEFTEKVRNKTWRGFTGKPIQSIVNIGIGGSYLGPQMVTHALKKYANTDLTCHFISNIDSAHLEEVLAQINPETTLFIISSKSFTTLETLTHAKTVRRWLEQRLHTQDIQKHFVAVTASPDKAIAFGISEENVFPLWSWVGGRYSIWSAIGLPVALMIGMEAFLDFLKGARAMDEHFKQAPFTKNMPVILALLSIWYVNFFNAAHLAVIPYSHRLQYLHPYLQQLEMESNGKSISLEGHAIDFLTSPVLFGEQGSNSQHAFHQLLHQGQHFIPVDFILIGQDDFLFADHQDMLISSALSQAQSLMRGRTYSEIVTELQLEGYSKEESERLAHHKMNPGNRPSNILFLDKMSPYHLGMLIALYEHKTFVQGAIWEINSFDQWGVELGKMVLSHILKKIHVNEGSAPFDSSTENLITHYKSLKENSV